MWPINVWKRKHTYTHKIAVRIPRPTRCCSLVVNCERTRVGAYVYSIVRVHSIYSCTPKDESATEIAAVCRAVHAWTLVSGLCVCSANRRANEEIQRLKSSEKIQTFEQINWSFVRRINKQRHRNVIGLGKSQRISPPISSYYDWGICWCCKQANNYTNFKWHHAVHIVCLCTR